MARGGNPRKRGRVHGNVIELEPGKLVCLLRSRAADHIYRSESNDNGETWSVPVPTPLRNNNASISAIKLQSGALAIIYNDVSFNEDGSRTVWPDQRCPVAMAISEDGGKTWPWRRIAEHGEGFIGPWNDVNNRRYEYPVMMQSKDGKIHAAYAWGRRVRISMYASMKHGFAALRFARALRIIPKCPATVDNLHDCPAVFAAGHFW